MQQVAPAQIDLFATRFNHRLPVLVSPVLDPLATAGLATCRAPRASAIEEQGLSEAVAARVEAPQRGSI